MRLFLILLGAVIILIFAEPIFEDVLNFGTVVGIAGGLYPLILGFLWNKTGETLRLVLLCLYAVGFLILLAFMLVILCKGKSRAKGQKAVIVLGCSVKGDKPSLSLIKRVDAAADFLKNNPKSIAVLSGGQGADELISEAECMKQLLTRQGIAENRLLLEDKSTTTDENIRFSKEILDSLQISDCAIATSEYHQLRAGMICRRYGITAHAQSSKTKLTILPTFLLREIFAITKEQFRK